MLIGADIPATCSGDPYGTVHSGVGACPGTIGWDMAEPPSSPVKDNKLLKGIFAVSGIMSTLVIYGVLQVTPLFFMYLRSLKFDFIYLIYHDVMHCV